MIIRSPEPEVKILVDRDPIKTSFEEWAKPGHFSRTIAKGPDTTTWIWNLHADAHDFDSHTSDWRKSLESGLANSGPRNPEWRCGRRLPRNTNNLWLFSALASIWNN
ncbi:hypothetical protein HID58_090147 [Brassica napus]|uniref:Photosystem I P700 chlorophyll a apoprotein A1 n=1 Tax=Brassica napus TaxID=3708 RepID=A0ABQ7XE72_BRANA|nr:hypothetical protein HID58_090147 [Brassica napus]